MSQGKTFRSKLKVEEHLGYSIDWPTRFVPHGPSRTPALTNFMRLFAIQLFQLKQVEVRLWFDGQRLQT